MMGKIKDIVRAGVCVALIIGGQLALSGIAGVEIVTVMMLCFCFSYGIKNGIAIATTFSLLRCFVFGFYINIIVLYLVYYNLFALFFGWLGKKFLGNISLGRTVIVVASAIAFTICFTLLDDVITPLMFGFSKNAMKAYFFASLYQVIPQTICTMVTVSTLFKPITKLISKNKF